MAQYRLSVQKVSRSDGRSGLAMAAYRAGEKLPDHQTGETIDYSRKRGVLSAEVILPENAPEWASDRAELWNRSEAAHRVQKAVVAREIELSLPHELTNEQRRELTTDFARFLADTYQVAVDTALHAPSAQGDERNYHAHLLICTRTFDDTKKHGLGNNVRDFDAIAHQKAATENHVELWRETWAKQMNEALERAGARTEDGVTIIVDHRSYERQGREQEPMIKEGAATTALKRRGEDTERATQNEEIRDRNAERTQLTEEIRADAQELDLLVRRQAELMQARDAEKAITPTPDPTETLTTRSAKDMIAPEVAQEIADGPAANDNAPDPPQKQERQFKRAGWESDEQYERRVQRALEREKEAPKLELNLEPKGHEWSY